MTALTAREQQVLDLIRDSITGRGYPPTLAELATGCGLTGRTSMHYVLTQLQAKGAIERDPGVSRGIRLRHLEAAP